MTRTDRNNNPVAFTTEIARQARLNIGIDYIAGEEFLDGAYTTAKIIGDPLEVTIRVINTIGFVTKTGKPRWIYINLPQFLWDSLTFEGKRDIIGFMYQHEGGLQMKSLFPNYGRQ